MSTISALHFIRTWVSEAVIPGRSGPEMVTIKSFLSSAIYILPLVEIPSEKRVALTQNHCQQNNKKG